jgi:hypothetical protein
MKLFHNKTSGVWNDHPNLFLMSKGSINDFYGCNQHEWSLGVCVIFQTASGSDAFAFNSVLAPAQELGGNIHQLQ